MTSSLSPVSVKKTSDCQEVTRRRKQNESMKKHTHKHSYPSVCVYTSYSAVVRLFDLLLISLIIKSRFITPFNETDWTSMATIWQSDYSYYFQ